MQRAHRTVHRFVWILVLAAAAVALVASVQVRPEVPVAQEVD